MALPPVASQSIEAAVVADASERVGLDGVPVLPCSCGQSCPREAGCREARGHRCWIFACRQGCEGRVGGQECRVGLLQQIHGPIVVRRPFVTGEAANLKGCEL